MRKLTDDDLAEIIGNTIQGYRIEEARIKRGNFTDSDHYGIVLGKNDQDNYVTWQFHLLEDETVSVYWGHYFMENREAAIRDFHTRDTEAEPGKFKVTITETLQLTVLVEADNQWQAEQTVSNNWKAGEYVLGADNFADIKIEAVPITNEG